MYSFLLTCTSKLGKFFIGITHVLSRRLLWNKRDAEVQYFSQAGEPLFCKIYVLKAVHLGMSGCCPSETLGETG